MVADGGASFEISFELADKVSVEHLLFVSLFS